MKRIRVIEARRLQLLEEMNAIRSVERASLKGQMLPVKLKGREEPVMRGPYYVLARWENGKTKSRRVRGEELEWIRQDVANHKQLRTLFEEFEELTECPGRLEREENALEEAEKKGLNSPSSKAGKSRG